MIETLVANAGIRKYALELPHRPVRIPLQLCLYNRAKSLKNPAIS